MPISLDRPRSLESDSPAAPLVVVISSAHGFAHLVRTLLEDLNISVRTSAVAPSAVVVVEELQPHLVILDLIPGQETASWLVLEALKARASTHAIPVLLCPAVPWLLDGHRERLEHHGVRTWSDSFDLRDLVGKIETALQEYEGSHV
jgi:CheY-like chemotaxis protein